MGVNLLLLLEYFVTKFTGGYHYWANWYLTVIKNVWIYFPVINKWFAPGIMFFLN